MKNGRPYYYVRETARVDGKPRVVNQAPCSKRVLPEWCRATAIQQIRPVEIAELDSKRYWDKWDRVREKDIEKIASLFFDRSLAVPKAKKGLSVV